MRLLEAVSVPWVRLVAVAALFSVGDAQFAFAQNPRGRGPFSGLFGIGPQSTNAQSLNARASAFGVWQNISFPGEVDPALLDPTFSRNGTFGGTVGSLEYIFNRRNPTSSLYAAGQGWVADYSVAPDTPQYGANAMVGAAENARLTRRLSFQAMANATYSPYFNLLPTSATQNFDANFPPPINVTPGFGVSSLTASNVAAFASGGISGRVSRRSTAYALLYYQQIHFFDQSFTDLNQLGTQVQYSYQLFRKLSFHAGYSEFKQRLRDPDRWSESVRFIDLGLDYNDGLALRLSRRTTVSFAASLGSARPVPGKTQYRILGNATLSHYIGRTWNAYAQGGRSLGFVAAFREPILADTASVGLVGQLANRIAWTNGATWTRGYIGLDTNRHFDSTSAGSTLTFGLTRRIGAFVQYNFYKNRLPSDASALAVLSNFDRQTVAAGLTLYAPIFSSQRTQ